MLILTGIEPYQRDEKGNLIVIADLFDDLSGEKIQAQSMFDPKTDDVTIKQYFLDYVDSINNPPVEPPPPDQPDPTQQTLLELSQMCLDACSQMSVLQNQTVAIQTKMQAIIKAAKIVGG